LRQFILAFLGWNFQMPFKVTAFVSDFEGLEAF
jgi:hypothetical protein